MKYSTSLTADTSCWQGWKNNKEGDNLCTLWNLFNMIHMKLFMSEVYPNHQTAQTIWRVRFRRAIWLVWFVKIFKPYLWPILSLSKPDHEHPYTRYTRLMPKYGCVMKRHSPKTKKNFIISLPSNLWSLYQTNPIYLRMLDD